MPDHNVTTLRSGITYKGFAIKVNKVGDQFHWAFTFDKPQKYSGEARTLTDAYEDARKYIDILTEKVAKT